MSTKDKEERLNSLGYEIEQVLGGYYICLHYKKDGTFDKVLWNDPSSKDAYIRDKAVSIAYDMVFKAMDEIKDKEARLNSQGYEIEQVLGGYYICLHYKENGTFDKVLWNDPSSKDAYIRDKAVSIAYDMVFLDI